jgi:hypothetical protein
MTVYVADAHLHVQRLISVVKTHEECIIEGQRSVVHFLQASVHNTLATSVLVCMHSTIE